MVRVSARIPIFPTKVGAEIRFIFRGCANRRFYQIGVAPAARREYLPPDEIIGAYDKMPNELGEKLVSLDLQRFTFWLGQGAKVSPPVADLLGLCGVLPITPASYHEAWKASNEKVDMKKEPSDQKPS